MSYVHVSPQSVIAACARGMLAADRDFEARREEYVAEYIERSTRGWFWRKRPPASRESALAQWSFWSPDIVYSEESYETMICHAAKVPFTRLKNLAEVALSTGRNVMVSGSDMGHLRDYLEIDPPVQSA